MFFFVFYLLFIICACVWCDGHMRQNVCVSQRTLWNQFSFTLHGFQRLNSDHQTYTAANTLPTQPFHCPGMFNILCTSIDHLYFIVLDLFVNWIFPFLNWIVCCFIWYLILLVLDRVLLCNFGWSGAFFLEQVGLKITEIHVYLPNAEIKHVGHDAQPACNFFPEWGSHISKVVLKFTMQPRRALTFWSSSSTSQVLGFQECTLIPKYKRYLIHLELNFV